MDPALTAKCQVTIPKRVREHLGIGPGQRVRFELLPDGRVAIVPLRRRAPRARDPFAAMRGIAKKGKVSTDDIMRMTRGEDWDKP